MRRSATLGRIEHKHIVAIAAVSVGVALLIRDRYAAATMAHRQAPMVAGDEPARAARSA